MNRTEAYRTDSGKVRYRVLLGIFQGLDSAQEFIAKEKLEEAYPLPWTDPAGLRQVEVTVLCRRDDSGPEQQATVILDPSAKEQGRELSLKWACQAPSAAAADGNAGSGIQVAPELLIAPYLSLNSLSAGAGSFSRLGYGLQLGAYRRSGVLGTLAEIEILREGGVKGGGYSRPPHALNASFRAGVVIEPFRGWSLEPMVALERIPFVSEAGGDDPVFGAYILPVAGMRTRGRLVRFSKGTEIGVELAYLHQFSARYETLTVNSGSDIRIGLGSRSPFSDRSSAEWNLQYRMSSRGTSIIPKQTSGAIHFSLRFRWSP